jgi:CheY-like chemotaxis protein
MTTKVLVFESDAEFAHSLTQGLAKYGCETKVVDDGEEGITAAAADAPDLILLTIELPRMNGFSVCNKLKRNAELKKVPLVLLSSEATDETFDQHKRLRTRADEYVHKPVTVDELVQRLAGIIQLEKTGGDDAEDVSLDEDLEIEEVEEEASGSDETDEAFGNIMAPAPAPAAADVVMDDLELEEGDGLALAPAEPPPKPPSQTEVKAPAPPAGQDLALEAVSAELAALKKQVGQLEGDLRVARDATEAEAQAKSQVIQKKDAEIALIEKEMETLRRKLETNEGGGTAREFLDLREQLNKKDKEIIDIRDQLSSREKQVVRLNDDNIALGRQNADLTDQNASLLSETEQLKKQRDAALSDKEQAARRGDDFKAKSERLQEELSAKLAELRATIESHENRMATRDAQEAAMRDDHAHALRDAAQAAEAAKQQAVADSIAQTLEKAAGEQEAALVLAAEEAKKARAEAVRAREVEMKAEHDSKLAALHRANEESLRKLRAEHEQASEEAEQKAADRLAARERELGEEREVALAAQKSALDAERAQVDAVLLATQSDLATRTSERDADRATIAERDRKVEELEARVASQRAELVELGDKLELESTRLKKALEKWAADEASLRTAKTALETAAQELGQALSRPIS